MNKYLFSIFALFGLLLSTSVVNAQYCYYKFSLGYDSTQMEQIGDFIYNSDDNSRRTGSTNRILLVDIDNVINKNLQLCGKEQPVAIYQKKCVTVKDYDRKFTSVQLVERAPDVHPCYSRDNVFIDIIDTKFSLTRIPNCGGISLKNISVPFEKIIQSGNITLPTMKDTIIGYENFPETIENYYPLAIKYYKPEINYQTYEFVVTNLRTNVITVYPSTIGESISLSEDNYTVELKIKGINDKLNHKVTIKSIGLPRTINISACDSFQFNNTSFTQTGTYTFTKANVGKCDSVITLNLTITKFNSATTLGATNITSQEGNAEYLWYSCDDINLKLPANNSQIFTPIKSGKYAVKLSKSGCNANSACVYFSTPLGTDDIDEAALFLSLAPNPTSGIVTLNFGKIENELNIQVINSIGNIIANSEIQNSKTGNINLQDQPSGVYFLIVHNNNGVGKSYKIIKN